MRVTSTSGFFFPSKSTGLTSSSDRVCLSPMEDTEDLVVCSSKGGCGNSVRLLGCLSKSYHHLTCSYNAPLHKDCFLEWKKSELAGRRVVCCVYCRTRWPGIPKPRVARVYSGAFVNLLELYRELFNNHMLEIEDEEDFFGL
eukprot:m.259053 g.259053  ORF g.259053 m.259053 type:complete len:142 (+) comp54579_c0_seq27:795-1220(+)